MGFGEVAGEEDWGYCHSMGSLDSRVSGGAPSPPAFLNCRHLKRELNESITGSDNNIKGLVCFHYKHVFDMGGFSSPH